MVAMVSQESADGEVLGQVITSFKVHPPSAGFVGKAVADRKIELPVDVGVERVTGLCTVWQGEGQGNGDDCEHLPRDMSLCFHIILFL